jgi:prevent-host-death family protein
MVKKGFSINVAEAKQQFSGLLGRVAYGRETIIILRRGKPMAKLVPIDAPDAAPHLADVDGWLKDDASFFDDIDRIVQNRSAHAPRAYKKPVTQKRRKP